MHDNQFLICMEYAAQLNKALEKQCYYLAEKVAEKVKSNIEEFIKNYYREYSPEFNNRTWRLLNSIVKSEPPKITNEWYFRTSKCAWKIRMVEK